MRRGTRPWTRYTLASCARRPRLRHRRPRRRPDGSFRRLGARWWRWSRSRCAPARSGRSTARRRRRDAARGGLRGAHRHRRSQDQLGQSHRVDCLCGISCPPPMGPVAGRARSGTPRSRCPAPPWTRSSSEYGQPAFAKVDVEGFEATVLAGLSWPLPAPLLRVHHHPARRGARVPRPLGHARGATASTSRWGRVRFSPSTAGSPATPWPPASPPFRSRANSGDVYCVLQR